MTFFYFRETSRRKIKHSRKILILQYLFSGSHNSGTYKLIPSLGVAIDQEDHIQTIGTCCCTKSIIHKWSRTQNLSLTQQLELGIRYFDIRIAAHPDTGELRFVHGLYGELVIPALRDIRQFLDENPREVVVLDFNHFYGMSGTLHRFLLSEVSNIFNGQLLPMANVGDRGLSLENIWMTPYRVICIYHNTEVTENQIDIWSSFNIEAPWAETNKVNELINFLDDNYNVGYRNNDVLYVWQGVLTAKSRNVILGPLGSLETSVASRATAAFVKWLGDKEPGPRGVNICMADFIEKSRFSEVVIELNTKMRPF